MTKSNSTLFNEIIKSLSIEEQTELTKLNDNTLGIGYNHFITHVGTKPENYKCEYKKSKSKESLFILRIDNSKWSLRCKLFHIPKYTHLLDELSKKAQKDLLSSKKCVNDGGCKGPVKFYIDGQDFSLCRHSMQFRSLSSGDIPFVWNLLKAESLYSEN